MKEENVKNMRFEYRPPHLKFFENIIELRQVVINFLVARVALNTNNFSRE
jgi:hypothetical protein